MTEYLVNQMRTCAAAIVASQSSGNLDMKLMASDAVRLLTEAAELLEVQQEPLATILPSRPTHRTRHFDDGSKHCLATNRSQINRSQCGNDPQAMRSIGRRQ